MNVLLSYLLLTATTLPDLGGEWDTTFGRLVVEQSEVAVTGRYPLGVMTGTVEGRRVLFTYDERDAKGEGSFELSADGASFGGQWRARVGDGWSEWSEWSGVRVVRNFSGLWETSYGRMRLNQTGDRVTGRYSYSGGATVEGEIVDGELKFTYQEPRAQGEGQFTLSSDANSFEGRWRPWSDTTDSGASMRRGGWGEWTGRRVEAQPDVVWLVILEAHWEHSLAEREYAFGDMLRSYFTMASAKHVMVRHRYFHDLEDFQRFSREVAFLAEPVVLLISTHGTPDGIVVGGETLGPESIVNGVSGAGNIELLHLSGCSMMKGDVPASVLKRLPPGERFPVSGYSTVVAWDASALADFTFLSMLLIRRLDPREAVRQTHLVAPFTAGERVKGSRFDALGLDVLMPDSVRSKTSTEPDSPAVEKADR